MNVIMPALGMAQETGKVLRWLKGEGDAVTQGEPLLEIETDKATVELEAPASGILTGVTAAAGETVPVGQVIAEIRAPGEASPQPTGAARASAASAGGTSSSAAPSASSGARPTPAASPSPATVAPGSTRRVAASPKARRLAREQGVDLARLSGSGPGGAVLAADVMAAQGASTAQAQPATLSTAWRLMAERTTQSWTSVPHIFLLREVGAGRLIAWRETVRKRLTMDVTYSDLLLKLVAMALREHPRLNARWEGRTIVPNDEINIGLAVANDEGLVVPVIHGADRLSLNEIAQRRAEVVARARAGKSRLEDLRGGTFTISNLGMYAVDTFTAIINAPQAAILAVGRIVSRVVPVEDRPAVRPMLALSLSCDHRVVDGARGAQFLETLSALIEEPVNLVE